MERHLRFISSREGVRFALKFPISAAAALELLRLFSNRLRISIIAAFTFLAAGSLALSQTASDTATNAATGKTGSAGNNSSAESGVKNNRLEMRVGPFDLHPRLSAGLTYDDNILLTSANRETDTEWIIHPALQAVAGDDAALVAYRDQNYDVLSLAPGGLIVQQPDVWPGKFVIVDYGPGFQLFDKYTANNHIDEFGTLNVVWPMSKLILGLKQDYQSQKTELIEFDRRTAVETITTTLSGAYQFGEVTSMESDFRRISVNYDQPGLTGYTEYNTEDWFNYQVTEYMPVSLGVLAGEDDVANHQNQTFEQLRARARYSFTEKLAFDVSGGGELREYENGKHATLDPVFTVAAEYKPTERTSLRLGGLRQQYASIFNGYNYSTTGATLELRQEITDRYTASVTGGYYSLDFTAANSGVMPYTGDYYLARMSFDAKIVRHLDCQIFYQYLSSKSQINSGSVSDDQTGIQLNLTY